MKRNGLNSNDVYYRLAKLSEENERLRNMAVQVKDVESLMKENHTMRLEI